MILSLEEIKSQQRIDADITDEDTLLVALGQAAEARTSTFLNRTLYASSDDVDPNDGSALVVTADLKLAMLMLVTHFYENRSSVSNFENTPVPMSYEWIVSPYRFIPL
ncbi:head-tail connector protein [Lonsdalea quercina]|uniref:head-tail connector protein n=1 Tax=Lonsdalea quercina TaxID=71657 RepID=UPI00397570F1